MKGEKKKYIQDLYVCKPLAEQKLFKTTALEKYMRVCRSHLHSSTWQGENSLTPYTVMSWEEQEQKEGLSEIKGIMNKGHCEKTEPRREAHPGSMER